MKRTRTAAAVTHEDSWHTFAASDRQHFGRHLTHDGPHSQLNVGMDDVIKDQVTGVQQRVHGCNTRHIQIRAHGGVDGGAHGLLDHGTHDCVAQVVAHAHGLHHTRRPTVISQATATPCT
jgi:hypothetical protein